MRGVKRLHGTTAYTCSQMALLRRQAGRQDPYRVSRHLHVLCAKQHVGAWQQHHAWRHRACAAVAQLSCSCGGVSKSRAWAVFPLWLLLLLHCRVNNSSGRASTLAWAASSSSSGGCRVCSSKRSQQGSVVLQHGLLASSCALRLLVRCGGHAAAAAAARHSIRTHQRAGDARPTIRVPREACLALLPVSQQKVVWVWVWVWCWPCWA